MIFLHIYFYLHSLPAVDGGLEAGAVDYGLGHRQVVQFNIYVMVVRVLLGVVHLLAHIVCVVPFRAIGKDGVDGQYMGIGDALASTWAMAEGAEVHLQRVLVYGAG